MADVDNTNYIWDNNGRTGREGREIARRGERRARASESEERKKEKEKKKKKKERNMERKEKREKFETRWWNWKFTGARAAPLVWRLLLTRLHPAAWSLCATDATQLQATYNHANDDSRCIVPRRGGGGYSVISYAFSAKRNGRRYERRKRSENLRKLCALIPSLSLSSFSRFVSVRVKFFKQFLSNLMMVILENALLHLLDVLILAR